MRVTKATYIDELVKMGLISSITRNKCVDSGIFTVGNLASFRSYGGTFIIRGLSTRSMFELQNVWDRMVKEMSAPVAESKPKEHRNLTRILSASERSAVSELENLFNSTFIEGTSGCSNDAMILVEELEMEDSPVHEDAIIKSPKDDFNSMIDEFLDFVIANKRFPEMKGPGREPILRKWYRDVRTGNFRTTIEQKEQYDNMRDKVWEIVD